jgi:phage tail sheath protein FI
VAAPGATITRQDTPPQRSQDTDTGKLLLACLTDRGPINVAQEVTSLAQFVDLYGDRQTYSTAYDELDLYFHEGGARAIIARYAGPSAAKAKRNLLDGAAGVALVMEALGVGSYANTWTVQVTHPTGSTFQIIIVGTEGDGTAFTETSPEFATTADAVAHTWEHVTVTQGASTNDPAVLAASVLGSTTTGADDRASATDTERTTALNLFTPDLGPGQVKVAGATAAATHAIVEAHAETYGRVALLDGTDTATVATLTALAATDRAATGHRSAGLFAPWVTIPGITAGTTRTVPPGALAAGIMARNDGQGVTPNEAAAGDLGQAVYATGLSQAAWSETDRGTLNDAGVNVIRDVFNGVRVYGDRTLTDPSSDVNWRYLSNARYFMSVRARAGVVMEAVVFRQIDARGHLLSEVRGDLTGLLLGDFTQDALYGTTPEEAFNVDLSANTATTIANGELHATLALRMSPPAENVNLAIVKVVVTESVA